MARALIALGSNLGDRAAALDAATLAIDRLADTRVLAKSGWIESAPVGGPRLQPAYLNGSLLIETTLGPLELLDRLQQIEHAAGRVRSVRWGPRTLDLDLLLYGEEVIRADRLIVPHPRMVFRSFVLEPATQIAADMLHPSTGRTVGQLWTNLHSAPPYLAMMGPPGAGKTRLAREIAGRTDCDLVLDRPDELCGSPDCAGPGEGTELEFLARRARSLGARGERDRSVWTISDFWLPQSLAWAEARGGEPARARAEAAWRQLRHEASAPRFVAVFDLSVPVAGTASQVAAEAQFDERLRSAMQRLADEPGVPPVIRLPRGVEVSGPIVKENEAGGDEADGVIDPALAELLAVLAG
ncbi:MAG TPA: 2-amino-4-hydroxy-6-hydroxymethyldihydropteridine diphosphokinase [Pirellulales bacterium]|nr:2-amino-4-hydroxy-6-hydroxymethyldihydropteridine diphosphokinase [Pirellulales bacterium]